MGGVAMRTKSTLAAFDSSADIQRGRVARHITHWYVNRVQEHATDRCHHCGHPLAWLDDVGWVAVGRDSAYDMCEVDPYGNHLPEPAERAGVTPYRGAPSTEDA
jgi:hypothetical protein